MVHRPTGFMASLIVGACMYVQNAARNSVSTTAAGSAYIVNNALNDIVIRASDKRMKLYSHVTTETAMEPSFVAKMVCLSTGASTDLILAQTYRV